MAFAPASTAALAGEGRAAAIARASVVGVERHMHPDVSVCSIGYDELIAVLPLGQQRGHAVQPAPGLWNGRRLFHKPTALVPSNNDLVATGRETRQENS